MIHITMGHSYTHIHLRNMGVYVYPLRTLSYQLPRRVYSPHTFAIETRELYCYHFPLTNWVLRSTSECPP